jgi:SHOCT-like domain
MATTEERMKILKMIQDGKISAEEGAKLLSALRESRTGPNRQMTASGEPRKGWLRVRVTDTATGKTKVNVNLPLGLVDAGMNIANQFVPEMGIEELSAAIRDSGMQGKIVDVIDEEDGEHVEIFIE